MARGTWGGLTDPNIFKVNIQFLLGTSKCQTGFKLRDAAVQDNSTQQVADQVRNVLQDPIRSLLGGTDQFVGVDVLKMGTEDGAFAPSSVSVGAYPVGGGAEMPNFMAANVALKSEIRKRYGQGRMFLPIVNDEQVDGNALSVTGQTRPQAFIDALVGNFSGSILTHDLILVNAHPALAQRLVPGVPGYRPAIPASWYDVVSVRLNLIVTMLRSRKAGVGS